MSLKLGLTALAFATSVTVSTQSQATTYSSITYSVDLTLNDEAWDGDGAPIYDDPIAGTFPSLHLTGTLTTDGSLGTLSRENVIGSTLMTSFNGIVRPLPLGSSVNLPGFFLSTDLTNVAGLSATTTALEITGVFAFGSATTQLAPVLASGSHSFDGSLTGFAANFSSSLQLPGQEFVQGGYTVIERISGPPPVFATAIELVPVPLPTTLALLLTGLGSLALRRRRN